jgi:hypothetical protein
LNRLLDTGAYSDLVIGCKDREWKVHKAIVLLSSKTLDDKFKVGITFTGSGITADTLRQQEGIISVLTKINQRLWSICLTFYIMRTTAIIMSLKV